MGPIQAGRRGHGLLLESILESITGSFTVGWRFVARDSSLLLRLTGEPPQHVTKATLTKSSASRNFLLFLALCRPWSPWHTQECIDGRDHAQGSVSDGHIVT